MKDVALEYNMILKKKHVEDLLRDIHSSGLAICRDYYVYLGIDYNRVYPISSNLLKDRLKLVRYLSNEDYPNIASIEGAEITGLIEKHPIIEKTLIRDGHGHCYDETMFEMYVDGIRFQVYCEIDDHGLRHYMGYNLETCHICSIEQGACYQDKWKITL